MSWERCWACQGEQPAQANCPTCHGNGGAFAMAPTPAHAPQSDAAECLWCGRTYAQHTATALDGYTPRMPCLGRKEHFLPRETRRG